MDVKLIKRVARRAARRNSKRHNYDDMISEAYVVIVSCYYDCPESEHLESWLLRKALNHVNRKNREDFLIRIPLASKSRNQLKTTFEPTEPKAKESIDISWIQTDCPIQQTLIRLLLCEYTMDEISYMTKLSPAILYKKLKEL